jgi:hypothetical protein
MSTIKSSAENLTLNADGANNDVIIQSNGSTKVTVDGQNSRVGIGTTTPSAALEVKNTTDGTTFAFQATNDNDHEIVQVGAQADGDGYLTVHGQGASTNIKVLLHSDAESHISGGDLKIGSGDIYFGTAGKGIVLGATTNVDANTLDDYEEGTWTVGQYFGSGSASITSQTCNYTKVGRLVTITATFNTGSPSSPSGNWYITGLPYARTGGTSYFDVTVWNTLGTATGYQFFSQFHGDTYFPVWLATNTTARGAATGIYLDSSEVIVGLTFSYITAA